MLSLFIVLAILLHQLSCLLGAGATLFVEAGGGYSGSFTPNGTAAKDVEEAASTYYMSQMPSTNVLPLLSNGTVDCPTWTSALSTQASSGLLTPVSFTAGNLTAFVLENSSLFAAPCTNDIISASEWRFTCCHAILAE